MKLSTKLVVALVIAVAAIACLLSYPYFSATQPSCTTAWACALPYPLQGGSTAGVAGEQCTADSTSVHCVVGFDEGSVGLEGTVNYAPLSSIPG